MKRLAGEIALTDCLTGGRLEIGVGRGAFAYEFKRFGVPVEDSRARFDESLAVLEALLGREQVSWDGGDYYTFDTLTTMPRGRCNARARRSGSPRWRRRRSITPRSRAITS